MLVTLTALTFGAGLFADLAPAVQPEALKHEVSSYEKVEKQKESGKLFPFVGAGSYRLSVSETGADDTRIQSDLNQQAVLLGTSYRSMSGFTFDMTWFLSKTHVKGTVTTEDEVIHVDESNVFPNIVPELLVGYTAYIDNSHEDTPYITAGAGIQGLLPSAVIRTGYQLDDGFIDIGAHATPGYGYSPELRMGVRF